jgi:hypothetical protein
MMLQFWSWVVNVLHLCASWIYFYKIAPNVPVIENACSPHVVTGNTEVVEEIRYFYVNSANGMMTEIKGPIDDMPRYDA